ncbi:hypothetical protein B0H19DRAFT_1266917 [Mycena capillaripes]|nr:hypothetical protein B0H19DRAFT_1266917 [Mycena capillaripes]
MAPTNGTPADLPRGDSIVAQCSRRHSLRVDVDIRSIRQLDWLRPTAGRFVALEKPETLPEGYTQLPDIFLAAPSLCEVILADARFRRRTNESQFNILEAAPCIVYCAAAYLYFDDGPTVTHPRLRGFCFKRAKVIRRLIAPVGSIPMYTHYYIIVPGPPHNLLAELTVAVESWNPPRRGRTKKLQKSKNQF